MTELDVVSSSTDLVSSVYDPSSQSSISDSSSGLVVADEEISSLDTDSLHVSLAPSLANPTIQGLLSSPVSLTNAQLIGHPEGIQIITLNNPNEILSAGNTDSTRWQLATIITVGDENMEHNGKSEVQGLEEGNSNEVNPSTSDDSVLMPPPPVPELMPLPADAPEWAKRIRCCEKIGDYYRGYVESDMDLDLLLTFHKQQTQSLWGTRQSPSPAKPSTRLMWKSQYVPMDGIPFVNTGSRAVVMECQYGPRRKGNPHKKETNASGDYKLTCPARIYVKRVKKFPEFSVDLNLDKKTLKMEMDRAFHELKQTGFNGFGQERYYVQLPTEKAHEFHDMSSIPVVQPVVPVHTVEPEVDTDQITHRLDPRVAQKIRDLVASGETRVYAIRKQLRAFVTRDLYHGGNVPERHDLTLFPTVNDLKNHIHQALKDVENGTLPLTAPTVNVEIIGNDNSRESSGDQSLWLQQGGGSDGSEPVPETVTVTLTQQPGEDGHHVISRIETHLSDGTTRVSTTLTPETAQLLSRLHPNMFPAGSLLQQQIDQAVTSISEKILTDQKPDETNDVNTDENTFSSVDNFMPSFSTSDSLVTSFNSVPNLSIDGLQSEDGISSQYTIENLGQHMGCENLDQSMNSIENTSQIGEEGNNDMSNIIPKSENSEISESQSQTHIQTTELGIKRKSETSHLQIDPLPSESQISETSSQVAPLEINTLSGDMTGIIQIPYSVNGLQIIPISGVGNNLFSFSNGNIHPVQIGQITSDDNVSLTYSSSDCTDMQIDNSQSIADMQITFSNDDVDSTQLEHYSIKLNHKDNEDVQSNQISSEMSQEEMETAIDESLMQGNLEDS